MIKLFNVFLLTIVLLSADSNTENNETSSYIDDTHKAVSHNILETSKYIDDTITNLLTDSYNEEDNSIFSELNKDVEKIDLFYKNEKFMDSTDKSFVRIRASSVTQSIENNKNDFSIKARLSLYKTKRNIRLFIENDDEDYQKNIDGISSDSSKMNVGISYLTPNYYGIDSKYSAGISGFYPYLSARYKIKYEIDRWLIEPIQSFRYSFKNEIFEEKTNIYFDTKLDNLKFFRIRLSRGTNSDSDGMYYSTSFTYAHPLTKKRSLSITQSFSGNTRYEYIDDNDQTVLYRGISTYSTNLGWRQSIWKKWFFYEIGPGVDFSRHNDYKVNYKIYFLTDFYFGYY